MNTYIYVWEDEKGSHLPQTIVFDFELSDRESREKVEGVAVASSQKEECSSMI